MHSYWYIHADDYACSLTYACIIFMDIYNIIFTHMHTYLHKCRKHAHSGFYKWQDDRLSLPNWPVSIHFTGWQHCAKMRAAGRERVCSLFYGNILCGLKEGREYISQEMQRRCLWILFFSSSASFSNFSSSNSSSSSSSTVKTHKLKAWLYSPHLNALTNIGRTRQSRTHPSRMYSFLYIFIWTVYTINLLCPTVWRAHSVLSIPWESSRLHQLAPGWLYVYLSSSL